MPEQRTAIAPLPTEEMTFPVTALGTVANDWLSSSGNKVTDVQLLDDGKFIYIETPFLPEEPIITVIKFTLNLGGLTISSPAYETEQFPFIHTVDFLSLNAPGSTGWTMQQFLDYELESADETFVKMQSFKAEQGPPTCSIIKAGLRASLQHAPIGAKIQRRVLKLEKLLKYEPA